MLAKVDLAGLIGMRRDRLVMGARQTWKPQLD
jgi:hypothetical protein